MDTCPCHRGKEYSKCCQPYHEGKALPPTALELMRSRYSAFALHLIDYIIETTHPKNPAYREDKAAWAADITAYAEKTDYLGLDILEFKDGSPYAYVSFRADLKYQGLNVSFTERSRFERLNGKWLYLDGVIN